MLHVLSSIGCLLLVRASIPSMGGGHCSSEEDCHHHGRCAGRILIDSSHHCVTTFAPQIVMVAPSSNFLTNGPPMWRVGVCPLVIVGRCLNLVYLPSCMPGSVAGSCTVRDTELYINNRPFTVSKNPYRDCGQLCSRNEQCAGAFERLCCM